MQMILETPKLLLLGYLLSAWSIVSAIWHTVSWLILKRELAAELDGSGADVDSPVQRTERAIETATGTLASDADGRNSVFELEMNRFFGPLLSARSTAQSLAVFYGSSGTLAGFLVGADSFSVHGDVALTLKGISLALVTSLIGAAVSQWEAANARQVAAFEPDYRRHAAQHIDRWVPLHLDDPVEVQWNEDPDPFLVEFRIDRAEVVSPEDEIAIQSPS